MSISPDSRTSNPGIGIHDNHWCEHPGCKQWGCYGFSRSKADKPIWHCSEHYPHKPFNRD
ncbi:hypothetical protein J2046_000275 [Rhizobium petrolearium]|nr:hypothetical protein [Neorhizobium petrolearium]